MYHSKAKDRREENGYRKKATSKGARAGFVLMESTAHVGIGGVLIRQMKTTDKRIKKRASSRGKY